MTELSPGTVLDGTVTGHTPFGVFVTVAGDVPGLLLTQERPAVGSTVTVRVKEFDPARRRVALVPAA